MALLTIPEFPEKGTLQEYSLNVTDLIALIADSYFQDQANWSKVVVMYQSSESNQLELINFIPDGSSELFQDIQFSTFARDLFEIHSITVFDYQNGRYIIRASEIPDVASFNVDFGIVPPPVGTLTYELMSGLDGQAVPGASMIDKTAPTAWAYAEDSSSIGSATNSFLNIDVTFELENMTDAGLCYVGVEGSNGAAPFNPGSGTGKYRIGVGLTYIEVAWMDGGYIQSGVPVASGPNKTIRLVGENNINKVYVNGVLAIQFAAGAVSSYTFANLYPFVYGFRPWKLVTSSAVIAPVILAGAYGGFPQIMQNKTSATQPVDTGEGQEFVLSSPAQVSSVKVLLAKSGNPTELDTIPLGGSLKMVLKASGYSGAGAEVESTNSVILNDLPRNSVVSSSPESYALEFTFATPVSLPAGTNAILFKLTNYDGNGLTVYMSLYGYSPTITDGIAYSYGTPIAHVDYWFQIIG